MANPRQRRKARSSSHKPVSHSQRAKKLLKKTPPIRGPKLLQDAWDKHKTVRQNYAALGLAHTLNPLASGGAEYDPAKSLSMASSAESSLHTTQSAQAGPSKPASSTAAIPKGFGKIIRDADGNVIRVELGGDADDETPNVNTAGEDGMQGLQEPELDKQVMADWVTELGRGGGSGADVVKSLEILSAATSSATSGPRHTSGLETLYLARLIQKHGEDVESMARDRRVNPEQRTAGELRRGIRRAGGVIVLQAMMKS